MSNKNPFEIRAEVLQMAKDYMDQQYHVSLDFARKYTDFLVETGKATQEEIKKYTPTMYSTEELMEKAQEFYSFVTKKD
jgi:hypothetical protein